MIEAIITIELLVTSYYDIRYKAVPKRLFYIMAVINGLIAVLGGVILQIVLGSILGIILLIMARMTREAIGYGDGILVLLVGIVVGTMQIWMVFMLASILVLFYGIVLCVSKKVDRKYAMPLIPFIAVAYIIYEVLEALS